MILSRYDCLEFLFKMILEVLVLSLFEVTKAGCPSCPINTHLFSLNLNILLV